MSRTALVTFLVAGGCSTHVGCSIHSGVSEDGSNSVGSGSSATRPPARPKESMATIVAGTYVASDPVFAPDADGRCSPETIAKVEILAKKAPWPDRPQPVAAFTIDKMATSCSDYRACAASGACPSVDTRGKCATYPAIRVTQEQAIAYCKWRGARLPTLLQWQAAVRGPTGTAVARCDGDDAKANCVRTTESGVQIVLGAFAEHTSTLGCRGDDGLHPVLAASYDHDLSGFVLRTGEPDADPQLDAFRCVHDELVTSNPTKDR